MGCQLVLGVNDRTMGRCALFGMKWLLPVGRCALVGMKC